MKFFECSSAEGLAGCYSDCDSAASNQVEVFVACAQNSICDPACRTNITPKPSGGGQPRGTGATSSSCSSACDKLVSCSFIRVGDQSACVAQCQQEAYQYQIDCVNGNACGDMRARCGEGSTGGGNGGGSGGGTGGGSTDLEILQCQQGCDSLLFRDCASPQEQSNCRDKCVSVTSAKRTTFSSCVQATHECTSSHSCYDTLVN